MRVEVLYLAWNRLEFTETTFTHLQANTDWSLVDRLIVYDDASEDGTSEFLDEAIRDTPIEYEFRFTNYRSPVATMKDYLSTTRADLFAKVDNDLVVPPGWLSELLAVMERNPQVELLGMESCFMGPPYPDWDGVYWFTPWRHMGGNGLMRVDSFKSREPMDVAGYHGFTGWQWRHDPVRGWITPDMPVCLLDRCPLEPWKSLSRQYVKKGWQRPWRAMPDNYTYYWEWMKGVAA